MQSFLDSALDNLPEWQSDPNAYEFILPSKRAGFFLRNSLAHKADRTFLAPRIWSIEDFVEDVSGLRYAGQLHLMFRLYEAYLDQDAILKESFADFAKWAPVLLQDFNEADRYLVDTDQLFGTLAALKEIRNWSPDGGSTPLIDRQIAFWKHLGSVYKRFRALLAGEGLGYQGMIYRSAVDRLDSYLGEKGKKQFVFIGFNALNTAETRIIRFMMEEAGARVFWDADPHYLDNPVHDAGHFIRKYRREWPSLQQGLDGISRHFGEEKKIELVGMPKAVAQAKYCGSLIDRLHKSRPGSLDETALVLGDETLLNPVLHALPSDIPAVNVTMSYPIRNSPISRLFDQLLEMRINRQDRGWNVRELLDLLAHPYLQEWFRTHGYNPATDKSELIRRNLLYADSGTLQELGLPRTVRELLLPENLAGPAEHARNLKSLAEALKPVFQAAANPLHLEYLFHFHRLFSQLIELAGAYPFVTELKSLHLLFRQLVSEEKVDFEGKPLSGLQVMGMLESRNLDFETVIITSVNEGILPAGKSNASFIPYDIKREFGLPTYKEKDAVYTYHFYRLLQRARNIYICYNLEPDVLEGGEPSRFISQLRTDPLLKKFIEQKVAIPETGHLSPPVLRIKKDPLLLDGLRELAAKGFSPTSLSRYISDPLLFYRRNVLKIPESDLLEETVAANTFGTVLHHALEVLYKPLEGEFLDARALEDIEARSRETILNSFREHYLREGKPRGRNLIALEVLRQYLSHFIQSEKAQIRNHHIRILGVERKIVLPFQVAGLDIPVQLRGTVDRIEEVDGAIRIIDFKTGMVAPAQLRISDWESLGTDPDQAKAFQILCYALMYARASGTSGLKAGIVSFKNLGVGRQWFGLKTSPRTSDEAIDEDKLAAFSSVLEQLLREIFDPSLPFEARPA